MTRGLFFSWKEREGEREDRGCEMIVLVVGGS